MFLYLIVLIFVFGLIIGSFLNVVILRHGSGRSLGGRSFCTACGKTLGWTELVPLFSFIFLRGRCRSCKSKISWQYALVEFSTGLIFVLIFLKFFDFAAIQNSLFIIPFAYSLIVWCLLEVMFAYELNHQIIPDSFVYSFIILSLVFRLSQVTFVPAAVFSDPSMLDLLSGPILFLPFFSLWYFSGGKWMGFGDGKLALGIGFQLGLLGGISAVMIGFWIGAIVSIIRLFLSHAAKKGMLPGFILKSPIKNLTMKSEVAFAPFLIMGVAAVYFFGFNVIVF